MHLQPAYADFEVVGGAVGAAVFADGLCLPSGSAMTEAEVERVVGAVCRVAQEATVGAG